MGTEKMDYDMQRWDGMALRDVKQLLDTLSDVAKKYEELIGRRCDDCKWSYQDSYKPEKYLSCDQIDNDEGVCSNVEHDFYCKKWEPKDGTR